MRFDEIPDGYEIRDGRLRRVQHAPAVAVKPTPTTAPGDAPDAGERYPGTEAQFQADAEKELRRRGYRSRTYRTCETGAIGWYFHLTNPRQEGLLLDLLIWRAGRIKEIELKGQNTTVETHQRQLVEQNPYCEIAWNMPGFCRILDAWEATLPDAEADAVTRTVQDMVHVAHTAIDDLYELIPDADVKTLDMLAAVAAGGQNLRIAVERARRRLSTTGDDQ